jgi:hypothetical protein
MTINNSLYLAEWPGFFGVLTEGNIDSEVNWTEDEVATTFKEQGFTDYECMGKILLDPRCMIFDDVLHEVILYTDDVEEVRRLFEFLGAPEWQTEYATDTHFNVRRGHALGQDDREDWAAYIREWDIPSEWTDEAVEHALKCFEIPTDTKMSKSDLSALVWLLDSMPSHQSEKFDTILSNCLARIVFWEEDNFNDEKIVTYISSCANLLKGRTILRTFIMESFSKAVALWCFQKCGREVMKELQFSLKEDYYLPCIVTNVRHYVADMPWSGEGFLGAAIHEYDTSALTCIIDMHWEEFEYPIWTQECNEVGMGDRASQLVQKWKDRVTSDFMMHWFSFDFRAYLPFLNEPVV